MRQATKDSLNMDVEEITDLKVPPINCKLEIDCNVNENFHLSPDMDQKGEDDSNRLSFGSNSTLYDKYCTKNGQCKSISSNNDECRA